MKKENPSHKSSKDKLSLNKETIKKLNNEMLSDDNTMFIEGAVILLR